MKKKDYTLSFYKQDGGFLECIQCSHPSSWQAAFEAELYIAWAEYHYKCKVFFKITES